MKARIQLIYYYILLISLLSLGYIFLPGCVREIIKNVIRKEKIRVKMLSEIIRKFISAILIQKYEHKINMQQKES